MRSSSLLKGTICLLAMCGLALIVSPGHASATINPWVSFQGKLTNTDGTNVSDGNYSIRFRIYTSAGADALNSCAANSCKWEETQGTVAVSSGLFNVNLGSGGSPLPGSVDFNSAALYLGIKVGGDAEMTPRIQLTASPQAFNSDLLDGLDSNAFVQLSGGNVNIGSGTVTSGAVNGVTIGSTIQPSTAGAMTVSSNGANPLTLTAGATSTWSTTAGGLTIQAATTNTLILNTSGAGTVELGNTNTTTINIGGTSGATTNIAIGNVAHTVHIADGGTSTNQTVTVGSANSGSSTAIQGGTVSLLSAANITIGAANSTATLLVLDSRNVAGETSAPAVTGVNGSMYYNSANNKFRCYQNSIWQNCSSEFNTITKTADQAATQSSVTMQNDSALAFAAAANTTYVFDAWIPVNDSNATADLKYTFTTPASSTLNIMTSYYSSATANVSCNIIASGTACANTTINQANHFIQVRGQATIAGTAGTVQFQFAQNTSTAASFPVIKKGATLSWHQSN